MPSTFSPTINKLPLQSCSNTVQMAIWGIFSVSLLPRELLRSNFKSIKGSDTCIAKTLSIEISSFKTSWWKTESLNWLIWALLKLWKLMIKEVSWLDGFQAGSSNGLEPEVICLQRYLIMESTVNSLIYGLWESSCYNYAQGKGLINSHKKKIKTEKFWSLLKFKVFPRQKYLKKSRTQKWEKSSLECLKGSRTNGLLWKKSKKELLIKRLNNTKHFRMIWLINCHQKQDKSWFCCLREIQNFPTLSKWALMKQLTTC